MLKFLESLSIISSGIYFIALLALVSITDNPVFQSLFFIMICFFIIVTEHKNFKSALLLSVFIGIPVFIMNTFISSRGATIILRLSDLPLVGNLKITVESAVYALVLTLKLINTILVFAFFNLVVRPDKILNLLSFFAPRSALAASLTSRIIPSMIESTKQIAKVQMMRGAELNSKNIFKRVKSSWPFFKIILFSTLEGSWQTAEALESKGYGSSKRRAYFNGVFRYRDVFVALAEIMLIILGIVSSMGGILACRFFPRISFHHIDGYQMLTSILIVFLTAFPLLLGGVYLKCTYLRQKI